MEIRRSKEVDLWMLLLICLSSSCSSSSSSASSSSSCSILKRLWPEICKESNCGPGPLNLTARPAGYGGVKENERAFIYHCVRYFTQLRWYRLRDTDHRVDDIVDANDSRLQPFPWGRGVCYLEDNQTVVIPKVERGDDRIYVFVASNETHQIIGRFRLRVYCNSRDPSLSTAEQPVQHAALGSHKTLSCAVSIPDCFGKFYDVNVLWKWQSFQSGSQNLKLKNNTLHFVSVVCDNGNFSGRKCDVLIRHVEAELYHGEFVCLTDAAGNLNQTVRLVPIGNDVKTCRPCVLAAIGAAPLALIVFVLVYYKHRIQFYCRSLPDRRHYEADVVILHGEDHERLVREVLVPQVRALGYTILDSATPGKLELLEQLEAVEKGHSVLLALSCREVAKHAFLACYLFRRKTPSTVLFIRCHDNHHVATPSATQQTSNGADNAPCTVREHSLGEVSVKNVRQNEALRSFKTLTLPEGLRLGCRSEDLSGKEARDVERFWTALQNHLPTRSGRPSRVEPPGFQETKTGGGSNNTESRPLLMEDEDVADSSDTPVSQFGTFPLLSADEGEM